ncbi:MAG: NADPH:quinone oxidoreductase family protein [Pseudomonadales bacterium]|nr:NADPH:quinone oxidoreductase family protein [Pseudomonadales bacterium]
MKTHAMLLRENGPPTNLELTEMPVQTLGERDVLIEMKAAGVSYVDMLQIAGQYQVKPHLPFVPGQEGSGIVAEIGPSVRKFAVGDRVITSHSTGAWAERAVLDERRVTALPDGIDFVAAAGFRSNYATALLALQRARLQAGEVLLVHSAAGGVGMATVHIGKLMGATVIGTSSSDEKLAVVKAQGADHVVNYSDGFRDEVKSLTGGKGADVIFDPVGGDVFDESMRCINYLGRIVVIGFTGGRPALAKTNHLLIKDASVIGMTVGSFSAHEPEAAARNAEQILTWVGEGKLTPYVSHTLPLARAAEALELLRQRKVVSKAVLTMSDA